MTDQASIEPYESIGLAISAAEVELLALGKTAAADDLHKALCQVAALRKAALQPAPSVDLKIEAQEVPAPGDTTSSAAQDGPASSAALSSQEIDVDAATGCADDQVWKGVDLSSVDLERAMTALKEARGTVGTYYAKSSPAQQKALAKWALFHGDPILKSASALSSRKGGQTVADMSRRNDAWRKLAAEREEQLRTIGRERDDLRHRLDEAADQFAFYADEHAKKGTVAGDAKACTNRAWSVACAKPALTKEPSHGE